MTKQDVVVYSVPISILAGFCVIFYILIKNFDRPESPEPKRTSAMSPAQCEAAGGCGVQMLPKRSQDLYSDGTHPSQYK